MIAQQTSVHLLIVNISYIGCYLRQSYPFDVVETGMMSFPRGFELKQ